MTSLPLGPEQRSPTAALNAVLQTIKALGLKFNKTKCHFGKQELQFFGNIISTDGIKPSPTVVEELCQVLSLISYVGTFLPDLSSILHLVTSLLKETA